MAFALERLREILVAPGHVSAEVFADAQKKGLAAQKSIEETLVEEGILSDRELGRIIADSFGWQFVDLELERIPPEVFRIIPELVAKTQEAVAFDETPERLKIATANPTNYALIANLEKKTGKTVEVYYATPRALKRTIASYERDLSKLLQQLLEELRGRLSEEGVVKLVDLILDYAYHNRASDVHLEPAHDDVVVRFRVDGVLYEVERYSKELHERVVFRIKILARLKTDEHQSPQDGKFQYERPGVVFDVRVSVVPITTGENVALRLLAEHVRRLRLEELGLLEPDERKVRRAIAKPYGMILSAGPTGSGKTTTLYAIIQIVNRTEINIMTIEDPVEYDIEGVHQIQVNPKTNLTFASGLRSIVRQDPNIIFVGEMRDEETANIAINAALTGHLLLSTIHANDAPTVFPRLMDLKIEPYLIASSVNVVVAQRLVRKICPHCIKSYFLDPKEATLLAEERELVGLLRELSTKEDPSRIRFYKGVGCKTCAGTGYLGRTGIFEVLEVAEELRPLIVAKAPSSEISKLAISLGMTAMLHDGIQKVLRGITTIGEVIRVTKA